MRRGRLSLLPLVVFVVLAASSVGAFVISRRLADDQERRLLIQRADGVRALLTNAVDSIGSSLRVLGPIGASSDPAAQALFGQSAGRLVERNTRTVGIAAERADGVSVVAAVGDGPAAGQVLTGERRALVRRALELEEGQLVSDLITDGRESRLVLARRVEGAQAVAYQESVVQGSQPVASTPGSPFRELRVALYASRAVDKTRLILTTEAQVPLPGRVERVPLPVGADQWLLAVSAREPLVGSFARTVPWQLLGGGLVMAVLATVVVDTLARRRTYALALVGERTRELEHALTRLGEANAFVDRLMTALPVLVTRVSAADGRLTYVSPNVERVLGISEDDALGPDFLERHIHPEDVLEVQANLARVATDGVSQSFRFRQRRSDGSYVWLSAVGVPDLDDAGRVTGIFGYAWDISDRRRAEEAQREAQEAAEAANRAKSEFLSRMSHELRTPLNAVLGFGQLLEIEQLTDAQRDAVAHILKGGRHLLALINEVLDISRIETGDLALSPEPVLAAELVQEVVDLIRPLADQRGIQLVGDRSDGCLCHVFADRQRVKQILLNLLSNAVKYNRSRGSVAVSCEQPADTRVRITVADTGMGIPTERLGLLFTPFERLGAEHTGEEGTGIGLALSKRLATAMGGTLEVSTTLGQGSTFTVELPRVEGPVERYHRLNGRAEPTPEPAAHHQVVLHIEDNLSNLTLVERVLGQRAGIEVVAAMQGRLGLELTREHHPALVLLDLHLPDMSGEQVLQRLRDDPTTASIPVVIVSADATPGQMQRLLSAGATAYLTKPIDVRELLRILDEAVAAP